MQIRPERAGVGILVLMNISTVDNHQYALTGDQVIDDLLTTDKFVTYFKRLSWMLTCIKAQIIPTRKRRRSTW